MWEQSRTYRSCAMMKNRCNNPNYPQYMYYGGRGICYTSSWICFENFLADMGERPKGMTLERKDNNGNYSKDNCKWATPLKQGHNRRTMSNNTSGRKGVVWKKDTQKWLAKGTYKGELKRLYYGVSFKEACEARDVWEAWIKEQLHE